MTVSPVDSAAHPTVQAHFDLPSTQWAQRWHSLHLYVLPDPEFAAYSEPIRNVVRQDRCFGVQPPMFLHATIARLPWFADRVDPLRLVIVQQWLTHYSRQIAPFTLDFARPTVLSDSVASVAVPGRGWRQLVDMAVKVPRPERPEVVAETPHITFGYALRQEDGSALSAELDRLARSMPAPPPVLVDTVHLVAVHQDREAGIYRWDPVSTHSLGGRAATASGA